VTLGAVQASRSHKLCAAESDRRRRVDSFLAEQLPHLSRTRIGVLARRGLLQIGGIVAKPSHLLHPGEIVSLEEPATSEPASLAPEEIPLDVIYEDNHLLVLNKAAGMVVHPGAGQAVGTLTAALLHHCGSLSVVGGVERPGIVHRLDKETSGVMVVAKDDTTHRDLSQQFAERKVRKLYLAVVDGVPKWEEQDLDAPIRRHPLDRKKMAVTVPPLGRSARTQFRKLTSHDLLSLIECEPKTGRTHQIRVHLKHLGLPVAGDPLYGKRGAFDRQLLHARRLWFTHPETGKQMDFAAPVPADFPDFPSLTSIP